MSMRAGADRRGPSYVALPVLPARSTMTKRGQARKATYKTRTRVTDQTVSGPQTNMKGRVPMTETRTAQAGRVE